MTTKSIGGAVLARLAITAPIVGFSALLGALAMTTGIAPQLALPITALIATLGMLGAMFSLAHRQRQSQAQRPRPDHPQSPPSVKRMKHAWRVLVVESHALEAARISQILVHHGHEVKSVEHAKTAFELIHAKHTFDAVLFDVHGPGASVLEIKYLSQELSHHAVILYVHKASQETGMRSSFPGGIEVLEAHGRDEVSRELISLLKGSAA